MTNIEAVPDHILVDIFSYLSVASLVNVSNVCERWSSIIKISPTLMKSFSLRLTSTNLNECYVQNSIPGGLHINLCIQKLPHVDDKKAIKIHNETIKNHLDSLKKVEYKNFFDRFSKFKASLEIFASKIQHVSCTDSTFDQDCEFEEEELCEWPELKSLRIERSFYRFIKAFVNSKLSKLELIHTDDTPHKIKSLIDIFWTNQAQNLTELRIIDSPVEDEQILKVLELKKLKTFEINLKVLAENPNILLELAKGFKWKKLKFRGPPFNIELVRMIIGAHSNLSKILFHLVMFEDFQDILSQIFTFQPHIEHLRLSMNHGKFPHSPIVLEKLHTFEIEGVRYQTQINRVIEIIKLSPNLKVLKIHWIGGHAFNSQILVNILRAAGNLEYLHLGHKNDSFEVTFEMLQIIICEGKNLRKFSTFSDFIEKMRGKMRQLHESKIKFVVWDKVYEDIHAAEKLMRIKVYSHPKARIISTCEWKI